MTVTLDLDNASQFASPDKAQFQCWVEAALYTITYHVEMGIRLVEKTESAKLNGTYRGKPVATNILAFPAESLVTITPRLLGDLIICAPLIDKEAKAQHKIACHHWAHIVIHGCLHLLGYDHSQNDEAKVMESLEVDILQQLGITNPYRQHEIIHG